MTAPDLTASRATIASTARITLDRLAGACNHQRVKFQELFPNGFEATSEAACIAAAREHALAFDWDWAASRFLAGPAWGAYEDAMRPAREAYESVCAGAFARAFWAQETTL